MSRPQRYVLIGGATATLLMLAFPPFHFITYRGVELNLGYGWIFSPPQVEQCCVANVNLSLLLVQWLGVAMASGLLYFVLGVSNSEQSHHVAPSVLAATSQVSGLPVAPQNRELRILLRWCLIALALFFSSLMYGIWREIARSSGPVGAIEAFVAGAAVCLFMWWVWKMTKKLVPPRADRERHP